MKALKLLDACRSDLLKQELDKEKWNLSAVARKFRLSREAVRKMAIRYGLLKPVTVRTKKWKRV